MSPSKRSRKIIVLTFCFVVIAMALIACEGGTGDSDYPGPVSSPDLRSDEVTYPDDKTDEIPLPHGDTDDGGDSPSSWQPASGDDKLIRGEAFINQSQILVLESFPPQFELLVEGALPTPCHELRVEISDPDEQNRIYVEVYSLSKPGEICVQVLESFDENVPLKGFPSGEYSVWVNGEEIGEIKPYP
jgi:hypothetical protein